VSGEARPSPAVAAGRFAAAALGFGAAAAFLLGRLAPEPVEALASPWTAHATVAMLAAVAALVALGWGGGAILVGVPLAWALAVTLPAALPRAAGAGDATLRIFLANVEVGNPPTREAIDWLVATEADLLAIVECTEAWRIAIEGAGWTHAIAGTDETTPGGIGLFSRFPLAEAQVLVPPEGAFRRIDAIVETPEGPVRVLAVHPVPPVRPAWTSMRNDELAALARTVRDSELPAIVVGDLNETPFGRSYRELVATGGLVSARRVAGLAPTWPTRAFGFRVPAWMGIPIDHALATGEFTPTALVVGPDLGSDHRPLVAEFAWNPPP
jgi:endonuclease/exonuclease/phosphatase (EEP) superfamily protein YafD